MAGHLTMNQILTSWGKTISSNQVSKTITNRLDQLPKLTSHSNSYLPFGNGRSYGDSCLNEGGMALKTRGIDRYIEFDPLSGLLRCESGILLSEILNFIVPKGWFLPVTPGTRFVTLGGAIANDVHGKNHHRLGTFGCHLTQFELLRSDGQRLICSTTQNQQYFSATLGGLGLTGLITWAEIQLRKINGPWVNAETIKYGSLSEFFELCQESDHDYEYTVSWLDCLKKGKHLGRGLFMRGNHAPLTDNEKTYQSKQITFPVSSPFSLINPLTLKVFNTFYYHKQLKGKHQERLHYEPFFYPLDNLLEWNRLYGRKGFFQYQCVIPIQSGSKAITELLTLITKSGMGSFLAVLKVCGNIQSPGLLSFPMKGVSLALDFPNQGHKTESLFFLLDQIVKASNGRLYPAKDARMQGELFRAGYPNWELFSEFIDPKFSSSFWRRVME
jgi:FAD/FMN-containing dehydrogenase